MTASASSTGAGCAGESIIVTGRRSLLLARREAQRRQGTSAPRPGRLSGEVPIRAD